MTVWRPSCDRATCTVPRTGKNFSCRRSSGSRSWARRWCFVPTPPSPNQRIYEALEEREVKYAIRIPANDSLQRDIEELLTRRGGETQQEAVGGVQGLSLPSGQLEDSTQGGGQGGASPRGAVPASRIHCDELDASKSGGGAVLQQAGDSGAVDQRRKASSEDDAAQLSPVPVERGAAVAHHHCL